MTTIEIPSLRVLEARRRATLERGHEAVTVDELTVDNLLAELAHLVEPGKRLTKQAVAEVVDDALRRAAEYRTADRCWCGHRYADHVGRAGCTGCDRCKPDKTARATPQPGPHQIGEDVLVIRRDSPYFGRTALVVSRERGGVAVQLRGVPDGEFLRFEDAEVATVPRTPLGDYADPAPVESASSLDAFKALAPKVWELLVEVGKVGGVEFEHVKFVRSNRGQEVIAYLDEREIPMETLLTGMQAIARHLRTGIKATAPYRTDVQPSGRGVGARIETKVDGITVLVKAIVDAEPYEAAAKKVHLDTERVVA